MAQDPQFPESNGLLGISPDDPNFDWLKQLRAMADHMGPSGADKQTAKMHAILTAGLGILANANKPEALALGRGGLLGGQSYNDELGRIAQQRAV